jgi:hypothetical protein
LILHDDLSPAKDCNIKELKKNQKMLNLLNIRLTQSKDTLIIYQSCFYCALKKGTDNELEFIAEKVCDPKEAYKKD